MVGERALFFVPCIVVRLYQESMQRLVPVPSIYPPSRARECQELCSIVLTRPPLPILRPIHHSFILPASTIPSHSFTTHLSPPFSAIHPAIPFPASSSPLHASSALHASPSPFIPPTHTHPNGLTLTPIFPSHPPLHSPIITTRTTLSPPTSPHRTIKQRLLLSLRQHIPPRPPGSAASPPRDDA